MPIYEYRCRTCGKELEAIHKVGAPAPHCPDDPDHGELARQTSRAAFVLRGEGWAADGYAGKPPTGKPPKKTY